MQWQPKSRADTLLSWCCPCNFHLVERSTLRRAKRCLSFKYQFNSVSISKSDWAIQHLGFSTLRIQDVVAQNEETDCFSKLSRLDSRFWRKKGRGRVGQHLRGHGISGVDFVIFVSFVLKRCFISVTIYPGKTDCGWLADRSKGRFLHLTWIQAFRRNVRSCR